MIPISGIAPFVAPFAVFMLFLVGVDGYFPDQHYALYPVKILLVMAALAWYWRRLPSLKPTALAGSLAVGTLGVVLWVGLDPWSNRLDDWIAAVWHRVMSLGGGGPATTCGRDPFRLYPAGEAWVLFAIRLGGIALVVPVMEELFWRGFLMRWLIKEDFASVPLGAYQALSFWATTVCFASVHGGNGRWRWWWGRSTGPGSCARRAWAASWWRTGRRISCWRSIACFRATGIFLRARVRPLRRSEDAGRRRWRRNVLLLAFRRRIR
jgi:CAAX prenyl protease-like protein